MGMNQLTFITVDVERNEVPCNYEEIANISSSDSVTPEAEVSNIEFGGWSDMPSNTCDWWCQIGAQFPLLNKIFTTNCAFPATSTSSERVFSMDGLILIP